jgi:hypothetical protein
VAKVPTDNDADAVSRCGCNVSGIIGVFGADHPGGKVCVGKFAGAVSQLQQNGVIWEALRESVKICCS